MSGFGDIAKAVVMARVAHNQGTGQREQRERSEQQLAERSRMDAEDRANRQQMAEQEMRLKQQAATDLLQQRAAARNAPQAPVRGTPEYIAAIEAEERAKAKYAQPKAPKEPTLTDGQKKGAGFYSAARQAGTQINQLGTVSTMNEIANNAGMFGNWVKTPQGQLLDQANRQWATAVLRQESGATITDDEIQNAYKTFLPRPGDSPEVLAQKARARKNKEESLRIYGGVLDGPSETAQSDPQTVTQRRGLIPRPR